MRRIVLSSFLVVTASLPALADEIELVTGERLKGTIVERDDAKVILDHPVLGTLVIPAAQVKPGTPAPLPTPTPGTPAVGPDGKPAPGAPGAPAAPVPAEPPPPPPWKFRVELGLAGSSGNTDQSDLHAAVSALYKTEKRRFRADGGWAKSETDHETTKNQQYVEATHDWFIKDSPWSVFATGRKDWDEFQDWNHRASLGGGVGYLLIQKEKFEMRLRAGLVYTREWGSSDEDNEDWRPEGLLGAEVLWKPNELNTIEGKTTWYPDFDAGGEYRVLTSANWSVKLAKDSGLSLKVGVEHEYDTHREDPFEKSDFRYFAALLWEF